MEKLMPASPQWCQAWKSAVGGTLFLLIFFFVVFLSLSLCFLYEFFVSVSLYFVLFLSLPNSIFFCLFYLSLSLLLSLSVSLSLSLFRVCFFPDDYLYFFLLMSLFPLFLSSFFLSICSFLSDSLSLSLSCFLSLFSSCAFFLHLFFTRFTCSPSPSRVFVYCSHLLYSLMRLAHSFRRIPTC
uniref:Uncharacterized protein n=1 Tax=Rhipicephalus pulchellus TaxID=72859 RepID=L7LZ32_RHIPC